MKKVMNTTFLKTHKLLFFSVLIFGFLLLLTVATTLSELIRDDNEYEVVAFEYGEGTVNRPYLISNKNHLEFLREQVDNGITYEGVYFQLARDIDLEGDEWNPIGTRTNSFRGILEGAGHTISNMHVVIELPSTNSVESYGLFASLGGGSTKTIVKNINLESPTIEVASFSATGSGGINIGSLAGTMYRNTEVNNIIVNNLNIRTTMNANYTIRSSDIQVFVGGLIGVQTDTSSSTNDPGTNNYSHIRNCYVDINTDLSRIQPYSKNYINQQALGGIVGTIRMQAVWPENCLVEGILKSGSSSRSGFIGPIFGYLQGTSSISTATHNAMFAGTQMGNLTISSYFNNLTIQSRTFTNSQLAADVPNNTTYRISTSTSNVGNVQGINKGISLQAESITYQEMLEKFNTDESITDIMWQYENNKFSFKQRLSATINEIATLSYDLTVEDPYNIGNYTYTWYESGEVKTDFTETTFSIEKNIDNYLKDHYITVIVYDGSYYAMDSVTAKKLTLSLDLTYNQTTNSLTGTITGELAPYIDVNDYTFTWTREDITGYDSEVIDNNNGLTLENISTLYDYKVEGVHSKYEGANVTTIYSTKTVIFVSSQNGNNNNEGLTPSNPVQTMAEAYSRFPSTNDMDSNIVVLMGDYNTTDFLYSSSNNTKNNFSKNATVTGLYKQTDYNARLYFYGAAPSNNANGRYLYGDTKLMYMTLRASTSNNGSGQTYLFCQGNNLTIGKEVYLSNYSSTSNTNGLIDNTTAPDFHIMGGFNNYNQNNLSGQSNNGVITIQSGAFARIILGSRNTQVNNTSHNFTGTSTDPFNMKLVVDIENSTRSSTYNYDINLIVGGQTDGNMYGNSNISVYNGEIGRLLGGSIGYSRTVSGYPSNGYYGSTTVNVYGGEILELFGGSLGRLQSDVYFYGPININIHGGTITNNIYGVGAGGVTGYSTLSSDPYKSYGQNYNTEVNINITGGTLDGNLYGAGYGYSSYLASAEIATDGGALYGNSNITISGGTINGDIYGAGRGYTGYFGKNELAQMYGNTNITIKDDAKVNGNVYGAGEGVSDNTETAKLTGNSKIQIETSINNSVYGAGNNSYQIGNTEVYIKDGTISNDVYGGGNVGNVDGTTNVYIQGGKLTTIYGGGKQSNTTNTKITHTGGTTSTIYGGANETGTINSTKVNLNGGTINTVYGGNNLGGTVTTTTVTVDKANITGNIYGGGNKATTTTTNLELISSENKLTNVFAGGESANIETTNTTINGIKAENIYAGSNKTGTIKNANINMINGEVDYIYGGNNEGGITNTNKIIIDSGKVTNLYGGGNKADTTTSSVTINNGEITNTFGGGNEAGVTDSTIIIKNGTLTNVYGGGNKASVTNPSITIKNGNISNIYGGSNISGDIISSKIVMTNGIVTNLFGGGNKAEVETSNVNIKNGTVTNLYGGGNEAGVTNTNVITSGGNIANIFGGSNKSGNVTNAIITTNPTSPEENKQEENIQEENKQEENVQEESTQEEIGKINVTTTYTITETTWQSDTYPYLATVTFKIENASEHELNKWNATLNMPDSTLFTNYTQSVINENNGVYTFDQTNRYYDGSNVVGTNSSYEMTFEVLTTKSQNDFELSYILEGIDTNNNNYYITDNSNNNDNDNNDNDNNNDNNSNNDSNNDNENNEPEINDEVELIIGNIYGGNNLGGTTSNPQIIINKGTITNIYGGGNKAEVSKTDITVNNGTITNLYGGGNEARVNGNTEVIINEAIILENIYGGGNEGIVDGNTNLNIKDLQITGSIYGGGNGATATVTGNTLVNISGNTIVGNENSKVPAQGSVFGGGKAAPTGVESINSSTTTVNIVSGTIYGNVYGGANTSVVYGNTTTNIGTNIVNNPNLTSGNIIIKGTVFGGGEANAEGSEEYDYSYISVTKGIDVNINAKDHNELTISGSIFGSGNASSTSGYSKINISNYGTLGNTKRNISIQRTNTLLLNNSYIELIGATDRTNEYSDVLYTLSRIDELKLTNNSNLFLRTGANLLKKVSSLLVDGEIETIQTVKIDQDNKTVEKNVDNRIYMYEGKNLNIATNESSTSYGEINGMAFFGLYTEGRSGQPEVGMYKNKYQFGELITSADEYLFTKGSYVIGLHETNHDIKTNGFYSNFSDNHFMKIDYITPTPEDSNFYMWIIGEMVIEYNIDLIASKYSTLGAVELPLLEFSKGNTTFSILDFNYNGLDEDIILTDSNSIPRVAANGELADTVMSLAMKTSNKGWTNKGSTDYLTKTNNNILGTKTYSTENSKIVPSLLFYLYHSKNLETTGKMGTVSITLMAITKVDDLTSETERLVINVNLSRALYNTNDYEGGITPGREYEMFLTQSTNISSKSSFSTYYSLFIEDTNNIYKEGYHRALVSSYVLPINTEITMIDYSEGKPKYYTHVINQNDINNAIDEFNLYGECSYKFSLFKQMGTTSSAATYNDTNKNAIYYNSKDRYVSEEFIFIIDFKNTNITEDQLNKSLLVELRDNDEQTIISVLGIEQEQLVYSLYTNKDAIIKLNTNLGTDVIYKGQTPTLTVETEFTQNTIGSNKIFDTNYFDEKLGLKLTIYDSNNEQVTSATLLGMYFEIDGNYYYPSMDGTTRINISETVANILSRIKIHTKNTNIPTGTYTIRIESFASPDGIYYGLNSSDTVDIPFVYVNDEYGLKVELEENDVIIDSVKGMTQDKNTELNMQIEYTSILTNPNIRIELYRREYDEVYQTDYTLVDLKDYFVDSLKSTPNEYEYILINAPTNVNQTTMYLKNTLITGTYKLKYKLYDNDVYIGSVEKYIIIQ